MPPLGNPRTLSNQQPPEKLKTSFLPEIDGNPLGPDYQHGLLHQVLQQKDVPEVPTPVDTSYRPISPPGLVQEVHPTLQEVSPNKEIIIALMGVTGAGKSYFIREVSGNSEVVVGRNLYSCTQEVQSYSFDHEGAKITLVDTPGFDDTNKRDTDVLREIADWTSKTYKDKRLLSGIIYLHPITHARMVGSALKNLRMFQSLCGQKVLSNVFLTTTQWSNVDQTEGDFRETSLQNPDFWGGLIDKGAALQRFHGTRESGLELIRKLIPNEPKSLDIQVEIVNQGRTLLETEAGKYINKELIAQEKRHKEEIESLKRGFEGAMQEMRNEMRDVLAAEQKKLEKVVAEKELLAELHAAEVEKRKGKEAEIPDRAVIAVATKDLEIIASAVMSYNTRGRLISDINNDEQFKSDTFGVTIHYESNSSSSVQVDTKKFLGTSDAGMGATSYITLDDVRYQRKPGMHRTIGGQNFIIFSKVSVRGT
jgi:hypothetical protein